MSEPAGNATPSGARQSATTQLREDHAAMRAIVKGLQRLMEQVDTRGSAPDFGLVARILYCIDTFSERCHHPREDEHLFRRLRSRTTRADAVLDELQAQHIRSAQLMAYVEQAFVHYQAGAADGHTLFVNAINAYATLLADHADQEETGVLPLAGEHLTEADWSGIAAAFSAAGDAVFSDLLRRALVDLDQLP